MSKASKISMCETQRVVRLGDVVENVNDFFSPVNGEVIRYVAGEHINEGELRVKRYGLTSDSLVPPTFNRLFREGDVLFHSRNIEKLARPNFGGLTGEKLFVLRTRDSSVLSQDYLPYLLQGARFRSYVRDHWAGSTNKFLNKTPLMAYEFELPSLAMQTRAARLLAQADDVKEALDDALAKFESVFESATSHFFDEASKTCPRAKLEQVSLLITNGFVGKSADHYVQEGGVPYLVSKNVRRNRLNLTDLTYVSEQFHESAKKSQLQAGDLLTVQSGHIGETAVVPDALGVANCHALIITRPHPQHLDGLYAAFYLNSAVGQRRLAQLVIGSTIQHLNTSDLRKLEIPTPRLTEQKRIAGQLTELSQRRERLIARIAALQRTRAELLAKALS